MSLLGTAFVIMWHDIVPDAQAEYQRWHTRQHMPERLSHRGFLRSRRGVNHGLDRQQYFTVYEGESLETFTGEDYAHSLNHPTDWTQRVAPSFRNFLRMPCAVVSSRGRGIGGALLTLRSPLPPNQTEGDVVRSIDARASGILDRDAVTGMHVAVARPTFSGGATRETQLRPQMHEFNFDVVVMVEGVGLRELESDARAIEECLQGIGPMQWITQCYDVAYVLTRENS